jgi:membrane dipeptidase
VEEARRIETISREYVFSDMHAHPSRFHRANVEAVEADEIELYRRQYVALVVANISSDMAYSGRYTNRDGTEIEGGRYKPAAGEVFALAADRLARIGYTATLGRAILADSPDDARRAQVEGRVALLPALEGGDALEGRLDNLRRLHDDGLRLIQLIHFRNNEIGHMQTWPYSPGGLTEFGERVVREANRLGIVIDMAHANSETMRDILALSEDPVLFSHGGVSALTDDDRAVTDEEIRLIAENGGVVGIWPNGSRVETLGLMVDFIEHVIRVGGIDHVGIGSDLRGVSRYAEGFGREANFGAVAAELLRRGYSDEDVGKVMGGNFFRVWNAVAGD